MGMKAGFTSEVVQAYPLRKGRRGLVLAVVLDCGHAVETRKSAFDAPLAKGKTKNHMWCQVCNDFPELRWAGEALKRVVLALAA